MGRRSSSINIKNLKIILRFKKTLVSKSIMVDQWNRLPADVVNSYTLSTFKNRLDKFMDHSE